MFIQVMQGEIKDLGAVRATMDRWGEELESGADGLLGGTFGASDDGQFVAVVRFDSEEAARRNSDRPEQAAWWSVMSAHFVGDVVFHDYPQVLVIEAGGSDDAGFIQIIQGRVRHPSKAAEMAERASGMLKATRPDVIGATMGISADGHFTETVAFASEAAAREGEMKAMPREAQEFMEELEDLSFIDLRNPWFSTH